MHTRLSFQIGRTLSTPGGQLIAVIFVDPETREGRWLAHSLREIANPLVPAKNVRGCPMRGSRS